MRNILLGERTRRDIDDQVARILRDIGNPEPPLQLELVRELLNLDRRYYSISDPGALREIVHRINIAGRQISLRPSLILEAIRKWDLKALWIPDRKRILISKDLHSLKQRWNEAHEVGHSIIPWHEPLLHGDDQWTLHAHCEIQIEAEANYAAGRLLFLREAFAERFRDGNPGLKSIRELAKLFGNSITSALWRAVECMEQPAFGLISQHPRDPVLFQAPPVRYFIGSPAFERHFSNTAAVNLFTKIQAFCRRGRGPVGKDDLVITDEDGIDHEFHVDCFHNGYDTLTFGVHQGIRAPAIFIPRIAALTGQRSRPI